MNTRQNKPFLVEIIVGIFVIALGAYIFIEAQGFPKLPDNDYGADLFPKILGVIMIVGGFITTLHTSCQVIVGKKLGKMASNLRESVKSICWSALPLFLIVVYIFTSEYLGGSVSIFLILLSMLLVQGVSFVRAVTVSVIASVVVWGAFVHLLRVPLPSGFLLG